MTANAPPRSGPRTGLRFAGALALALGALWLMPSACGLTKLEVREQLLALEKNRPIRDHGLGSVEVELDAEARRFTVSYLDVAPAAPAGPPLLLVHGTPSSLYTWSRVIFGGEDVAGRFVGLAHRHRVLAPDLPGHGSTTPDAHPQTFDELAEFLARFLERVGVEEAVVVGHSYGGEVAWRLALDRPARVAALVIVDGSGYRREDAEIPEEELVLKRHPLARFGRLATSLEDVEESLEVSFVNGLPADEARENHVLVRNADNWQVMIDLAREEEGLREEEIPGLKPPTLLVWGAGDANFAPDLHGRRFARDLASSRLVLLESCGHYPQVESPRALVEALEEFLEQLAANSGGDSASGGAR